MRIDELHKFSDGTLNDVHNALNDCLKGIRMQYFPSTIWRKGDKDRAAAMIQAIEKMLKTRRIMRSLEKFVGGRLIMATTIEQQTALDESLVPSSQSLGDHLHLLPTEEEVLDFLRFLGHSQDIRKSSGVDNFRLSQAQMLWGLYHRINIDFAYLIWEDFVYQVEHKSQKRSNEMNYPRFTKVIIDYFMTRKPSISRCNRIHWHYVREDALFSTIKVVSRHQATQQYGAILLIELTTAAIRNSKAYQEYYACAIGEAAPKPKASARKKKGDSASSTTTPTPTPTTTTESAP
nr:hypothetical protein [Tanacetum cinerariifolium]